MQEPWNAFDKLITLRYPIVAMKLAKYLKLVKLIALLIFIQMVCQIFKAFFNKHKQIKNKENEEYSTFYEHINTSNGYTILGIREEKSTSSDLSICLATHSTIDRLHWIVEQAEQWSGMISVAVFATPSQISISQSVIHSLLKCLNRNDNISISFSLVFESSGNENVSWQRFYTNEESYCSDIEFNDKQITDAEEEMKKIIYPQNILRNLARKYCPTDFILDVDIDMISNKNLSSSLDSFLKSRPLCKDCAYVVPVYEIKSRHLFPPSNKTELLRMRKRMEARRYHIEVYPPNQKNSNLTIWEKLSSKSEYEVNILYNITTYREHWEPILILHKSAPGFEEGFLGYGFTRNSHVYLLHLLQYKFSVLDNAFLSHFGFQSKRIVHNLHRSSQTNRNSIRYRKYKQRLREALKKNDLKVASE